MARKPAAPLPLGSPFDGSLAESGDLPGQWPPVELSATARQRTVATDLIAPRLSLDLHKMGNTLYKQHHAALFRDRVFTDAEWRLHHSWMRYLPEPVMT